MKPASFAIPLAVIALIADPTQADPRSDARAHIASATALHHEGKFADALDELHAAYALDPQPPLLYAMGQLLVALSRCDEAIASYERYLATRPGTDASTLATEAIASCKRQPSVGVATATASPAIPAPPSQPDRALAAMATTRLHIDPTATVHTASAPTPLHLRAEPPGTTRTEPAAIAASSRAEPAARPAPPRLDIAPTPSSRWYADRVADGLVAGGLAAGVAAALVYRGARLDRADADAADDYMTYGSMIDRAHDLRTGAMVGAALATSLVAAGIVHYVVHVHAHRDAEHR